MGVFDIFKKKNINTNNSNVNDDVTNAEKVETSQSEIYKTIIIKLDSRRLENPDLDIRYLLPERIEKFTNKRIEDNGYDYLSNTEITIFLKTKSIDNVKEIINLFNEEKICDCDLSKSAEIYVSENANEDIEKCRKIYPNDEMNSTIVKNEKPNFEHEKDKAIEVLKNILRALHEKKYSEIINYVDESEIDNLEDFLAGPIQETLDINNFDTIDEYGVECNFHPQYEYSQITIKKYNDNGDFDIEYDLTSNGEPIDLVLQLDFKHTKDGLKCIFENIDPQ